MSGDGKKSIHIDIGRHLPFFPLSTVRNSTMKVWYKVRHTEVWVPTRLFYSQGSKSIHSECLCNCSPGQSHEFHLYTSPNVIMGTGMCVMLLQKSSYMVYLYMPLSVLWMTDSRRATTRPEKRTDRDRERHIPLAYYEECCIALISESITFFSMYQLWLATEWDSLTCISLHMITMIFNVSYFYINIFSSQSMLAMKKWITMNE